MQTQCPHCQTRFRLTEDQVEAARGYVRCGVCQQVFNALDTSNIKTSDHDEADIDFNATDANDPASKDAFDFFDESIAESLPHVVPEKLREDRKTPSSVTGTLLWSIAILCLTLSLMLEYAWFNRQLFVDLGPFKDAYNAVCKYVDCSHVGIRQPEAIELTSRNVFSHPGHKQALLVNLSIRNNADFPQPFPVMQIDFSDVRGYIVAARRFRPAEYLGDASRAQQLLQPGSTTEISMAIKDPGKQAVTYEFNFL